MKERRKEGRKEREKEEERREWIEELEGEASWRVLWLGSIVTAYFLTMSISLKLIYALLILRICNTPSYA